MILALLYKKVPENVCLFNQVFRFIAFGGLLAFLCFRGPEAWLGVVCVVLFIG